LHGAIISFLPVIKIVGYGDEGAVPALKPMPLITIDRHYRTEMLYFGTTILRFPKYAPAAN
jgi:hypothetical protein